MILTSYMDESGTHAGSPYTAMAAIMGNVSQWSRFQIDMDRIKRAYGFSVFHTKKFKARSGDFKGWSDAKCMGLIRHKKFSQTRLHVVMESGHKNAGDAARIFHETKKALKGASELLASITFSNKDEFDPLMVADFLAHSTYMKTEVDLDEMERGLFPIVKEKTGLTHLEYDESGIDRLLSDINQKYEVRRAWGTRKPISAAAGVRFPSRRPSGSGDGKIP